MSDQARTGAEWAAASTAEGLRAQLAGSQSALSDALAELRQTQEQRDFAERQLWRVRRWAARWKASAKMLRIGWHHAYEAQQRTARRWRVRHATVCAERDALLAEIARLEAERDEAQRARRLAQSQLDTERRLTLGRYSFYHRHLAMGFVRTRDPELANWASVEAGHRIDQEGGLSFEDVVARVEAERDALRAELAQSRERERIAAEAYQQQQTSYRELETLYQATIERAQPAAAIPSLIPDGAEAALPPAASLGICPRCGRGLDNVARGVSVVAGGLSVCTPCVDPGEIEIARARSL